MVPGGLDLVQWRERHLSPGWSQGLFPCGALLSIETPFLGENSHHRVCRKGSETHPGVFGDGERDGGVGEPRIGSLFAGL